MGLSNASRRLSEIATAAADALAIEDICAALESGQLRADSTAAIRGGVAPGRAGVEDQIRELQDLWASSLAHLPSASLALALRASAAAAQLEGSKAPRTQVVWC